MRERRLKLEQMGISRWAYEELKAFCRQYPEKKAQAAALLGIQGSNKIQTAKDEKGREIGIVMPMTARISTPTADRALKRIALLEDCDLIDKVARAVDNGEWERALVLHCCYGVPYDCIEKTIMPTANRNSYFRARREFFFRLMNEREERQRKHENRAD